MRIAPVLLLACLVLLAACAESSPARRSIPPGEGPHATVRLVGEEQASVEVALYRLAPGQRVAGIALIAPDGRHLPARHLESEVVGERSYGSYPGYGYGGPSIGLGVAGGSGGRVSSGVGLGYSFGLGGADYQRPAAGARVTWARIPLPNPEAYRAAYRSWEVSIDLEDAAGTSNLRIPAPGPIS